MAGFNQLSPRSSSRSASAKKTLIITVALAFVGLLAGPPVAAGQSLAQPQAVLPNAPQQLPDQNRFPMSSPVPGHFPKRSASRKKALMDYNFKKLRQHAQDLTELAKSLQAQIEKTNENVLSLDIVKKAEQAEKLAKKIKNEAKGGL